MTLESAAMTPNEETKAVKKALTAAGIKHRIEHSKDGRHVLYLHVDKANRDKATEIALAVTGRRPDDILVMHTSVFTGAEIKQRKAEADEELRAWQEKTTAAIP